MVLSSSAMVEMCVILAPVAAISANIACSKDSYTNRSSHILVKSAHRERQPDGEWS
jgi:hypothetical protein